MFFGSALSPLSVDMVLFTVTGAISPLNVNFYTNGSVYTNGCYSAIVVMNLFVVVLCQDSTTPESRMKVWYRKNAFKPPSGLGCSLF